VSDDLHIAVDLGAGSGRVMLGALGPGELRLDEVRRFHYPPERKDGHLRWPFGRIADEVMAGLRDAGARARAQGRRVRSVGVDSWGVDYGLVDGDGRLLEEPVCYRDERTEHEREAVFARVPRDEIFARTGIQFLVFNTLYQLHAHARAGLPAGAARLLMIPDLLHQRLSGRVAVEYTNASTSQMLHASTRQWDRALLERLGLPAGLLPEIVAPGTDLGPVRPALELGLDGVRVIAPATHDTGSAVVGAPIEPGWAYVSSGTWSLVGVERAAPLLNADVAAEDFTNEGGAAGTVRFLKNVMGLWLLESCRREWQAAGARVEYEPLLAEVAARPGPGALLFPDDGRLFNPASMLEALRAQLAETGQTPPDDPPGWGKAILDSLALRYATVLGTIARLTGEPIAGVHIVGGGSQNDYLNQATADASGLPVRAGPVEATAIGNLLVQAIAAGRFASLAEARAYVRANVAVKTYEPRAAGAWKEARKRYAAIEQRYAKNG
jgi:rhamnulokinase